jgi:hypothetical protein
MKMNNTTSITIKKSTGLPTVTPETKSIRYQDRKVNFRRYAVHGLVVEWLYETQRICSSGLAMEWWYTWE